MWWFMKRPRVVVTGLGLSVVHGIIKEHRGTIGIRSHPDEGTTVTIKLPVTMNDR